MSDSAVGEALTESEDVSSRGMYFLAPESIKDGSSISVVLTLPHELTLAGPVRVCCQTRIQRTEERPEGKLGVATVIEDYEFLRGKENAG